MKSFFDLSLAERMNLLDDAACALGKSDFLLEKDIYVCNILQELFRFNSKKAMVFKGGTSLSKGFNLISRFSEDIDITIFYKSLLEEEIVLSSMSKNAIKKLSEKLKKSLKEYICSYIYPKLKMHLSYIPDLHFNINNNGDIINIYYEPVSKQETNFIVPSVKIEFGGRNTIIPYEIASIETDVSSFAPGIAFPKASIPTMRPERTFWEKMTLMHEACHREQLRAGHSRYSRHWYDAYMLSKHGVADSACSDVQLLKDVVEIESYFFCSRYSNFQECLDGEFSIAPKGNVLSGLQEDYGKMVSAKMIYGEVPPFGRIVEEMRSLQAKVNEAVKSSLEMESGCGMDEPESRPHP